ncbi:LysR family transcriptional regulator [Orrella sp. 11846]|uniref:LysR family transcriptional regulator n=1 Tax=Orrella sp. 11846 TaxID=3409913 RepID=UPI003B5991BB
MDTNFLHNFLLIVECGSMSEAARRLDITPAAIAQQVRSLERTFGTSLLQRAGRTVKPTPAGQRLFEQAKPLIQSIEALKQTINLDPFQGDLRLGAINTALHSFLPHTLKAFNTAHPGIHISILSGHTPELITQLERNEIDAAVCIHPSFTFTKAWRWDRLRIEPLTLLAPIEAPIVTPKKLFERYPLIRYDRRLAGGKQAEQYIRQHITTQPTELVELSSILAIGLMVEAGLGVSVIPDIDSKLLNHLNVQKVSLIDQSQLREIGLLSHQHSLKKPLLDELLRCYHSTQAS